MAGRRPGSAHRVIKAAPPPNVRRGSSLSSAAHEQLEQFAQQASSTVEHDAHDLGIPDDALDSPHDLDDADMLTNGSIVHLHPALHPTLPDTSFDMDLTEEDEAPQTAADIAFAAYGDSLKIDSALCKKLASETALREPVQRRHDQKLNIERRSNVEALLAQVTGELPARPCKNCHKGHGPWTQCVIYDGQMCGSCSNCWFNASGSRCTFHENNHPQQPMYSQQGIATAPAVAPPTSIAPMMTYQSTPIPQPSPTPMHIPPLVADVSHWTMSDAARSIVNKAFGEVRDYNRGKRLATRVEMAAKELAMRVAEFDEYCRTPEGAAEMLRENMLRQEVGESPFDDDSLPEDSLT